MTAPIAPFLYGTVEHVSRAIGELYSGSELTALLAEVRLGDELGPSATKWRRLAASISAHQTRTQTGKALVGVVTVAFRPDRTLSRKSAADEAKDEVIQALSLAGLTVRSDGKVARTARAQTDDEALQRTNRMREFLQRRGAHAEVLAYCRPELLRTDHYESVFEAVKGLGTRLRLMTAIDKDGYPLVADALEGQNSILKLNPLRNQRERNEQLGIASLTKGVFSAFRNPSAHEPRVTWTMTEQDALDVLGTLSLIHRRLDHATRRS